MSEHIGDGTDFDDASEIHHCHPVAEMVDDAQVVADDDEGQAQLRARIREEVEDLRADGNVEARNRFVGDQYLEGEATAHGYLLCRRVH